MSARSESEDPPDMSPGLPEFWESLDQKQKHSLLAIHRDTAAYHIKCGICKELLEHAVETLDPESRVKGSSKIVALSRLADEGAFLAGPASGVKQRKRVYNFATYQGCHFELLQNTQLDEYLLHPDPRVEEDCYCQNKLHVQCIDMLTYPRPIRTFKIILDRKMRLSELRDVMAMEVGEKLNTLELRLWNRILSRDLDTLSLEEVGFTSKKSRITITRVVGSSGDDPEGATEKNKQFVGDLLFGQQQKESSPTSGISKVEGIRVTHGCQVLGRSLEHIAKDRVYGQWQAEVRARQNERDLLASLEAETTSDEAKKKSSKKKKKEKEKKKKQEEALKKQEEDEKKERQASERRKASQEQAEAERRAKLERARQEKLEEERRFKEEMEERKAEERAKLEVLKKREQKQRAQQFKIATKITAPETSAKVTPASTRPPPVVVDKKPSPVTVMEAGTSKAKINGLRDAQPSPPPPISPVLKLIHPDNTSAFNILSYLQPNSVTRATSLGSTEVAVATSTNGTSTNGTSTAGTPTSFTGIAVEESELLTTVGTGVTYNSSTSTVGNGGSVNTAATINWPKFCFKCGHALVVGGRFCSQCGVPVAFPSPKNGGVPLGGEVGAGARPYFSVLKPEEVVRTKEANAVPVADPTLAEFVAVGNDLESPHRSSATEKARLPFFQSLRSDKKLAESPTSERLLSANPNISKNVASFLS